MSLLPPISSFESIGREYISEYELEDGCKKTRTLPRAIISAPFKTNFDSMVCDTPVRTFTEWSISAQIFDHEGDHVTCLNHTVSVRFTSSTDTPVNNMIANLISILRASRSDGALELGGISLDSRA